MTYLLSPFALFFPMIWINKHTLLGPSGIHPSHFDWRLFSRAYLLPFVASCKGKVANKNGFETETTIAIDTN